MLSGRPHGHSGRVPAEIQLCYHRKVVQLPWRRKEKIDLQGQPIPPATTISPNQTRWLDRLPLSYACVFLISFLVLFLGMDRSFDFYDEGLILVGAMRVAAGQVPHRDFYANYGPAQFYILAWLFDLFGRSILVERLYDLTLRASIVTVSYAIAAAYCRKSIAVYTTIVCAFWLFSAGLPSIAYPIIPIILLSLVGSVLVLPAFRGELRGWGALAAGAITGLVALFRYDVGSALAFVQVSFLAISGFVRKRSAIQPAPPKQFALLPYVIGVALLFLPPALLYLAVAPVHPFFHDIILYPAKYYARARRLPFPGLRWRSLENMALYLPILVAILSLYSVLTAKGAQEIRPDDTNNVVTNRDRVGLLILFGLLSTIFYLKGIVRISVGQMLLSLVFTVITLAVLYEHSSCAGRRLHLIVKWTMAFSIFTATWSALKEVRVLYITRASVLQEAMAPPGPASLQSETAWCGVPNPLHKGLCFLVDPGHAEGISYISQHTNPGEPIFIGLTRHDRLIANDLLTYFVTNRLPATHWSHFDPDLQTRADIQTEMIGELDRQAVRYIVLESQYDDQGQASNDSSKSSGVTLLDDYIRKNYRQVETFGTISVWLRNGAQP